MFRIQNEFLEIYWRKKGRREGWGKEGREKKKQKRKLAENLKRKITSGHCRAQYRQNIFSLINNLIYTSKKLQQNPTSHLSDYQTHHCLIITGDSENAERQELYVLLVLNEAEATNLGNNFVTVGESLTHQCLSTLKFHF